MTRPVKWFIWNNYNRRGDDDGDNTPQDRDDGTGDFFWNSYGKDVIERNTGTRATQSFFDGAEILKRGERWPDDFNKGDEAPNWLYYKLDKLRKVRKYGYRPQTDMTRDPYVAWYTMGMMLLRFKPKEEIEVKQRIVAEMEEMKMPFRIWRFKTWQWRNRLLKDMREHYVKRISYFRNLASIFCYEYKDVDDFFQDRIL